MTDKPIYTFHQLEAALCIWEWYCSCDRLHADKLPPVWRELLESDGSRFIRLEVTPALADVAIAVHDSIGSDLLMDDLGWSYDWDFIPWVCRQIEGYTFEHDADRNLTITFTPSTSELSRRLKALVAAHTGEPAHVGDYVVHGANALRIPNEPGNWRAEN